MSTNLEEQDSKSSIPSLPLVTAGTTALASNLTVLISLTLRLGASLRGNYFSNGLTFGDALQFLIFSIMPKSPHIGCSSYFFMLKINGHFHLTI